MFVLMYKLLNCGFPHGARLAEKQNNITLNRWMESRGAARVLLSDLCSILDQQMSNAATSVWSNYYYLHRRVRPELK